MCIARMHGIARGVRQAVLVGILVILTAAIGFADDRPSNFSPAFIVAVFGSTVQQQNAAEHQVQAALQKKYPGVAVVVAYTSETVIRERFKQGSFVHSLPLQLSTLAAGGSTHVAVLPLFIAPGREYDFVKQTSLLFTAQEKSLTRVIAGLPLLSDENDCARFADLMLDYAKDQRQHGEALVLVGHGAKGNGSLAYEALQAALWKKDPLSFVGTIEGRTGIDQIVSQLVQRQVKKVYLVPLLLTIGDHAKNDIFGTGNDSWKQRLETAGITVVPVEQGIHAVPGVVDMYVDHAAASYDALGAR